MAAAGSHPTRAKKVERDGSIVKLRLSRPDLTWGQIGATVGLSDRACRKIWKAWSDSTKQELIDGSPVDYLFEHITGLRLIRGQLQQTAHAAEKDRNQAARVGALKAIAELRIGELRLLQSTGLLPSNLRSVRADIDYRYLLEQIIDTLIERKVAKSVLAEINAIAGRRDDELNARATIELEAGEIEDAEEVDDEDDEDEDEDEDEGEGAA